MRIPENIFMYADYFKEVVQTTSIASTMKDGISFYLAEKVTQLTVNFSLNFFPHIWVQGILGVNEDNEGMFRKMGLLIPVTGIALSTVAAYKIYTLSPSFISKGVICGLHSSAIMTFSFNHFLGDLFGFTTIRGSLRKMILSSSLDQLTQAQLASIDKRSDLAASAALLASSLSLTAMSTNPILGNAVAYPLAVIVKLIATRIFGELYRIQAA